jgi:hypothetical protein
MKSLRTTHFSPFPATPPVDRESRIHRLIEALYAAHDAIKGGQEDYDRLLGELAKVEAEVPAERGGSGVAGLPA